MMSILHYFHNYYDISEVPGRGGGDTHYNGLHGEAIMISLLVEVYERVRKSVTSGLQKVPKGLTDA